jgi:hypothetical protein
MYAGVPRANPKRDYKQQPKRQPERPSLLRRPERARMTADEKAELYRLVVAAHSAKGTPKYDAAADAIVAWQERRPLQAQLWWKP